MAVTKLPQFKGKPENSLEAGLPAEPKDHVDGFDVGKEVVVGHVDLSGTHGEHPLRVAFNIIREDVLRESAYDGIRETTYAFPHEDGDHTVTITVGLRK